MGSESANLVCSPFFPPGILRSQDGEHLCRNDSHTGSGTKQERGGEGERGGEAMLMPAGTTCCPLSSGLALTCVGSEPHTDCSPHQVQAVSNQTMHFCCERLTSDHTGPLSSCSVASSLTVTWTSLLSPQPSLRVLTVRAPVPSCPPASPSRYCSLPGSIPGQELGLGIWKPRAPALGSCLRCWSIRQQQDAQSDTHTWFCMCWRGEGRATCPEVQCRLHKRGNN